MPTSGEIAVVERSLRVFFLLLVMEEGRNFLQTRLCLVLIYVSRAWSVPQITDLFALLSPFWQNQSFVEVHQPVP